MKIAVWWNLPVGGARRALHDHMRGLAGRGHELHVFRPPVKQSDWFDPDQYAATVTEIPLPEFQGSTGGYLANVTGELKRLAYAVPAMEEHSAKAGQAIRRLAPDVLFANTCHLLAAPSILRHVGDLTSVLYLQEPKRSLYEAMPKLPWVEPSVGASLPSRVRHRLSVRALARQARVERENAAAAGKILVNSHFSQESVKRAYGLGSTVAYLGVDTERFSPADLERERFVFGVGAITPTKGVELAIRACAEADLPLVWTGPFSDAGYLTEMRSLANRLNCKVEFREQITDDELIDGYRRCLVVIATARLEPFGYTPIEAGACGAPVVALAEGGFRETILPGRNGLLGASVDELAAGLRLIDSEAPLRQEMGHAGRELALERWSLESATSRLESALLRASR